MEATSPRNILSTPHLLTNWRSTKRRKLKLLTSAQKSETVEIRVCVNRSCNRQGSRSILDVLSGIAPPAVAVSSCGCLGRCGAGPNLAVVPPGSVVSHCGNPARAARVLAELCGPRFDAGRSLEALALRKKGEYVLERGNFEEAEALFSRAIELGPSGGLKFLYRFRSAARLGRGDSEGALGDAEEACRIDPIFPQIQSSQYTIHQLVLTWCDPYLMYEGDGGKVRGIFEKKKLRAYLCQGDVFLAMEEWAAAEKAYSNALLIDPSIRRSKSFKARVAKLQEKLIVSDASS